jgi:hypothetical protein
MIWDWDMLQVMQLIHADGQRNGIKYRWANRVEADEQIIEKFEQIALQRHDWDDSQIGI